MTSSSDPTLVVLAAGLGTRYQGLKQIDPVGPGETTIVDYTLADAARAGFGRAVIVVREGAEAPVRDRLDRTVGDRFPVDYVRQCAADLPDGRRPPEGRTTPWGTGHAVLAARHAVTGPFAVANADDHYGPEALEAVARHLSPEEPPDAWALVTYRLAGTLSPHGGVSRAVCNVSADGYLEGITEVEKIREAADPASLTGEHDGREIRLDPDAPASLNLWGFTPSVFSVLEDGFGRFLAHTENRHGRGPRAPEFRLPDAVADALRSGTAKVRVLAVERGWFGLTFPEDRDAVTRRLSERGPPWG